MGFSCKQCCYSAETISVFIRHVKEHRNLANFRFSCGLVGCPCSFRTATALQIHMYRNHSKPKPAVSRSPRCIDLTCHIEGCAFTSTNFSSLCEHLKWHIRDGKKIECPFESCKKNFRVRSTFLSHHLLSIQLSKQLLPAECLVIIPTILMMERGMIMAQTMQNLLKLGRVSQTKKMEMDS